MNIESFSLKDIQIDMRTKLEAMEFVIGRDADWKSQVTTAIREMAMSAIAIPDRANRLLERANNGEIRFQIPSIRESALLLYAAAHQILFAFLAAVIGGFAYALDARGETSLARLAWVGSAVCLIAVVVSMIRARALRRALRSQAK
jgi:hypothetical protein